MPRHEKAAGPQRNQIYMSGRTVLGRNALPINARNNLGNLATPGGYGFVFGQAAFCFFIQIPISNNSN